MAGTNASWSDRPEFVLAAIVGTIGGAVGLRVGYGLVVDNPINAVTLAAVVGGFLGAVAVVVVERRTAWPDPTPAAQAWAAVFGGHPGTRGGQGRYLHYVYGTLAGAVYPRVVWTLTAQNWWADLLGGVLSGVGFAMGLAVVGLGYSLAGLFELELTPRRVGAFLGVHLLYGGVLGVVTAALFGAV